MNNLFFVTVLFLSFGLAAQEKNWTLQDCVNHALEHNITIKQAELTVQSNEQDIIEAKGNFLPTFGASASHTLSIGNRELFPGQFVDRTDNSTFIGLRLNQTIFNGFRNLFLKEQSLMNKESNEFELARIKDDISLNVVNGYLNVLFNKENLETGKAQLAFSQKSLNQINELVKAGVQPMASVYDAKATLATDKQNLTTFS